jgi:hypothetical protein
MHPPVVTVASRPPTGRALRCHCRGPSPRFRCIGQFAASRYGVARGGPLWSEFASGGAPGSAVSVGETTVPGVASDPASQVEWSVLLIPADPEGARCQASAWFAGTPGIQRFLEGLDRLPGGSRDSMSLAQVIFRIRRHIVRCRTGLRIVRIRMLAAGLGVVVVGCRFCC